MVPMNISVYWEPQKLMLANFWFTKMNPQKQSLPLAKINPCKKSTDNNYSTLILILLAYMPLGRVGGSKAAVTLFLHVNCKLQKREELNLLWKDHSWQSLFFIKIIAGACDKRNVKNENVKYQSNLTLWKIPFSLFYKNLFN